MSELTVPIPPRNYRSKDGSTGYNWGLFMEVAGICIVLMAFSFYIGMTQFSRVETKIVENPCVCQCNNSVFFHKNIQAAHTTFGYNLFINNFNRLGVDNYGFVSGNSMQPTFFEGNMVLEINLAKGYVLRPGEIVRYFANSTSDCPINSTPMLTDYVVHRIVAVYDDNNIVVAGDNNDVSEVIRRCQIKQIIIGFLFT